MVDVISVAGYCMLHVGDIVHLKNGRIRSCPLAEVLDNMEIIKLASHFESK